MPEPRIVFHRPARLLPPRLPRDPVVLAAPPEPADRDTGSVRLTLPAALLFGAGAVAYLMADGTPALLGLAAVFVTLSIGVAFGARVLMRETRSSRRRRADDLYLARLAEARRAALRVGEDQRVASAWLFPSPYRLWAIATRRRRVWERRVTDADFLRVSAGVGRAPLATPIRVAAGDDPAPGHDPEAESAAERLIDAVATVGGQPAVIDLANTGVVSVRGPAGVGRGVVRAMVCQLAVLHAPDDVALAVAAGGEDWGWAKWLPHTHEPDAADRAPAGVVPMVADTFEGIADLLRDRLDGPGRQAPGARRRLVVVLDGYDRRAAWARSPTAARLLAEAGPRTAITVICVTERETGEPDRADVRVRVTANGGVTLENGHGSGPPVTDIVADWATVELCDAIARALAPLRLPAEGELTSLLGVADLESFEPESLWVPADDDAVLCTPIGVDGDGLPLVLDLKEPARGGMGPHGLVAGAPGSGKSELLRTLVTGLAMTHSPELLSFLFVDVEGAAAFAGLAELPHTAGLITGLADDPAQADRLRDALAGEQRRRRRILRDAAGVRDHQLRRAAGAATPDGGRPEPLPYLIVVVDEPGRLLRGRPDVAELLTRIGRTGGSLGVHLLLATEHPEERGLRGLDADLSYRICLRTSSAAESRVVIGSPDAHRLPPVPGSAYLKAGETVFERFRAARVSGPYQSAAARVAPPERAPAGPVVFGLRTPPDPEAAPAPAIERPRPAVAGPTEMQVVAERLRRTGRTAHQVWLAPLPVALPLDALTGPAVIRSERGLTGEWWPNRGGLRFPVGVIDMPERQRRQLLVLDFEHHGHLAVVGAARSGKSTFLRTLMLSAALIHTPDEAQFLCVDFGGGTLPPFERVPHVSGVAERHDLPRARRAVAEALHLVRERERLFPRLGADSAAGFRRLREDGRLPYEVNAADVFLLVDGWRAARGEVAGLDEAVREIARRGPAVGVHLVLTADRWADLASLRDTVSGRLELRLDGPGESEAGRRAAHTAAGGAAPGRGLAPPGLEYHVALPRLDGRDTADGLADAQDDALAKLAAAWQGQTAPTIRMLPERVTVTELAKLVPPPEAAPPGVPVGIGEHDLAPVHLDLTGDEPHLLLLGDAGSGRSEFLRTWMSGLAARRSAWEVRFIVVDYRGGLLGVVPEEHLGAYAGGADAARVYAGQLAAKLAERLPPDDVTADHTWTGPEFYLVVDDHEVVGDGRRSPLAPLARFLPHSRDLGLHVVVARGAAGADGDAGPFLSGVTDAGAAALMLSGEPREGAAAGDRRDRERPPGRGVLVRRQSPPTVVQVALFD